MSTRNHPIAFGLDRDGRMRSVHEVAQGLPCACICPCCKAPLIARKGPVRAHHFAHAPGVTPCLGGPETALHQMAKQIVADAATIALPAMTVREPRHVEPDQSKACEEVACPAETMEIRHAQVEATEDRFRPDVVISDGEKELWLEIRVAHRVMEYKHEALRRQGRGCLEIDIRDCATEDIDVDRLRRILLEEIRRKVWLAHPAEAAARERARAEWTRKENERRARARQTPTSPPKPIRRPKARTPRPRPAEPEKPLSQGEPASRWLYCPRCGHMGSLPYDPAHDGRRFQCSHCGATVHAINPATKKSIR